VRGLVELHGGSVSASSGGKNQGAEFAVRLPCASVSTPEALPPPAPSTIAPGATTAGRVLVVDDNQDGADLLGELLRTLGYDARVVYDGPSALAEADRFEPQVALIDIGLPVMDGYEVAQRIAEAPRTRGTKLVAVTGYGQQRDREASARAGFSAHLVKPVDVEQLREIVARLCDEAG
jgi:CheY-like chemotaxis protein